MPRLLLGLLTMGVLAALFASMNALAPTLIAARTAALEGRLVDAATLQAAPSDEVLPAGGVLEVADWSVHLGELRWSQTGAVYQANALNPLIPADWEWVLLPVSITSKRDVTASASLEVTLMTDMISMSHRYKTEHHHPTSTLPDELDARAIPARTTREGNVGWMIPSAARHAGACLIRLSVGDMSSVFSCAVAE
ncbi:hypothetical protein CXR34_08360 [Microbacterium hominis]|uniref:Uncharacterized protein n=1 Tax=Microbacterium hominis TaxID=162426 RepID=A0A2K9D792_9MICO|nr:hypothetical protein CXR34_08360 [Microbacterium hominis]